MIIPYTIAPAQKIFGPKFEIKLPLLKLDFEGFSYVCLIDSGATISIMHADFGRELGLETENGEIFNCKGIDGVNMRTYIHKIEFSIKDYKCNIDVAFSDSFNFPQGLLGRKDFFDNFIISFHQNEGWFEIKPI